MVRSDQVVQGFTLNCFIDKIILIDLINFIIFIFQAILI